MNRHARRAARPRAAQAKLAAAVLAGACYDKLPGGGQRLIEHPAAIRALSRAFARSIMDRKRQHLVRLTPEEGHAFPSCEPEHKGPAWVHWIAVGFDADGRGTFATLATRPEPGMPEVVHRAVAWDRIRARLAAAMAEDGAPVP